MSVAAQASLSRVPARTPVGVGQPSTSFSDHTQVVMLDYLQLAGAFDEHIVFCENGAWVRCDRRHKPGSRVVLHLFLPRAELPVVLDGLIMNVRRDAATQQRWMLIWFDNLRADDSVLLRNLLRLKLI